MIWLYQNDNIAETVTDGLEMLLSPQRKTMMQRYRFPKDRALCMTAYVLLRTALYEEYGITEQPDVLAEPRQKPVFPFLPYHFNLSHCDCAVACVLDDSPVGIDVQHSAPSFSRIRSDFLTERELLLTDVSPEEGVRFWTLKEAYGKYHGTGLCYDYAHTDFSDIRGSMVWQRHRGLFVLSLPEKKYALSVFSEKPLAVKTVTPEALQQYAEIITKKEVIV